MSLRRKRREKGPRDEPAAERVDQRTADSKPSRRIR